MARSGMGNGDPAIWALLKATDEDGNSDLERRRRERSWRSTTWRASPARTDAVRACRRASGSSCRSPGTSSRSAHRAASNCFAVGNSPASVSVGAPVARAACGAVVMSPSGSSATIIVGSAAPGRTAEQTTGRLSDWRLRCEPGAPRGTAATPGTQMPGLARHGTPAGADSQPAWKRARAPSDIRPQWDALPNPRCSARNGILSLLSQSRQ